jgi:cell division protein FtsL
MLSIKRDLLLEHKIDLLLVFQCVLCCVVCVYVPHYYLISLPELKY